MFCTTLRRLAPALSISSAVFLLVLGGPPPSEAAVSCTLYASVSGSDTSPGTRAAPLRSVQKLVSSLSAGQTGCLTGGGTFVGNATFTHGGGSTSTPVTLTSDPTSSRATIQGVLYVPPTSSFVTIDNVRLDATNTNQTVLVQLFGDYGRLINSELVGANLPRVGVKIGYSKAVKGVEVANNRIHNFGSTTGDYHGVYVYLSDGARVHDNYIYDNAGGYGIQLWPHSMNGRLFNNTIDGNKSGNIMIAGAANANGGPSSNNEIDHNILSNPGSGHNIVIFWSNYPTNTPGTGNRVHDNVYWNGNLDPGSAYCGGSCSGVTYSNNLNADPRYVDRTNKNFALSSGSPASGDGVQTATSTTAAPTGVSSIASGATLSGSVTWTVVPSAPVASVAFIVNGQIVATDTTSPYAYAFDTTSLPNGSNTVAFVLVMPDGTRYTQQVGAVTVLNQLANVAPPTVSGLPVVGEVLNVNTGVWQPSPTGYSYAWQRCDSTGQNCAPISGATGSSYTVSSADGGATVRAAVTAQSTAGATTAVSAPTAGIIASVSSIAAGATLTGTVHWTATVPAGTQSVRFWMDGTLLKQLTAPPYAYDLDTTGYANGAHILGVAWTDSSGGVHPATTTNVTVSNTAVSNTAAGSITSPTGNTVNCDRYAAPTGSDTTGNGGLSTPYATVDKLLSALGSGQTGCLRAGTYGSPTDRWVVPAGATLTAFPGEAATVKGYPELNGAGATISYLNIDLDYMIAVPTTYCGNGLAPEAVLIDASNVNVVHNNIYYGAEVPSNERYDSGVGVGWNTAGGAGISGVNVSYNRIHSIGCYSALGSPHGRGHGIYVSNANNSTFNGNWLYDIYGAGVQFYDGHSADAGPHDNTANSNVIDHVGEGFFLWSSNSSYKNMSMIHNVITNTTEKGGFVANAGTDTSTTFMNSDGYNIVASWACSDCGNVATSGLLAIDPQYTTPFTGSNTPDFTVSGAQFAGWGLPTKAQMG